MIEPRLDLRGLASAASAHMGIVECIIKTEEEEHILPAYPMTVLSGYCTRAIQKLELMKEYFESQLKVGNV